mmetsp:Transcript_10741/g.20159  ORF Transcript_10741/g.20159 Transcript_10741/m.20159 type:complete len:300 (-) Transcript_10741:631-1530(-)
MNNALDFVAGNPNSGALEMNPMDSDLASWVMMSGDLLGSSHLHSLPGGLGEEPLFGEEPFLGRDDPFMSEDLVVPNPLVEDPAEASIQKKQEQRTAGDNKKPTATTKTVRARKNKAPSPSKKTNASKAEAAGGSTAPSKRKFDRAVSNASVASGSASVGGDIADPTFKRQRRLEKNREIARNCRKRKREKYMKLEEEVVKLRQWNKQLEVQLNQGKDGRDKEVARKAEMDQMRKLIEKKMHGDRYESTDWAIPRNLFGFWPGKVCRYCFSYEQAQISSHPNNRQQNDIFLTGTTTGFLR